MTVRFLFCALFTEAPRRSVLGSVRTAPVLTAGERGAHRQFLRISESREGLWVAHSLSELRIYGHRSRPAPVRTGGHELSVAEGVARVASHCPTTRHVAE